jgi:hypothetical protein
MTEDVSVMSFIQVSPVRNSVLIIPALFLVSKTVLNEANAIPIQEFVFVSPGLEGWIAVKKPTILKSSNSTSPRSFLLPHHSSEKEENSAKAKLSKKPRIKTAKSTKK